MKKENLQTNTSSTITTGSLLDYRERWVDVREASRIVGVPVATLNTLRCRGGGPPFSKIRKSVSYKVAFLLDWKDANIRTSTSQGSLLHRA